MEISLKQISEITGIRVEVLEFALLMEKKLKENDHKGGWENCSPIYLLNKLKEEVDEVELSLDMALDNFHREKIMLMRHECADTANFCMMLSQNFSDPKYVKFNKMKKENPGLIQP